MSEERQERCDKCRFWESLDDETKNGHCRRYAPSPFLYDVNRGLEELGEDYEGHQAWWPITEPCDWCGEFVPLETRAADVFLRGQR